MNQCFNYLISLCIITDMFIKKARFQSGETGLLRRGRDSNPRYRFKSVQRFSKPALSATQAPLQHILFKGKQK
jgi:hypothetical protein